MIDAIDALEALTPPNFESSRTKALVADAAKEKYAGNPKAYDLFMRTYEITINRMNLNYLSSFSSKMVGEIFGVAGSTLATLGVAAEKGFHPEVAQTVFVWGKEIIGQLPVIGPEALKALQNIQPEQVPVIVALGGGALMVRGALSIARSERWANEIAGFGTQIQQLKGKLLETK